MDAILNFKEAAKAFQTDDRYLALQSARKANDEDKALQDKIGEFQLVRLDLNNEMDKDDKDEARIAELNSRVNQLYNDVMGNENMVAYNKAKDDIEGFMNYVNAIINAAIDGQNPMEVEEPVPHDCGDGCSSCSGC